MSSEESRPHEITKKRIVYPIAGVDSISIRRDVEFQATDTDGLTLDIYYPPDWQQGARIPVVVFVLGYPDPGFQRLLGCKQKEMQSYISWAQLMAASGMAAITYTTTKPAADVAALFPFIRQNGASFGLDENRIGVWACSGNVPNALSLLMQKGQPYLKCAVLCYGMMLDLDGSRVVAEASRTIGFANPCAGRSITDLPPELPLFVARAGQDQTPHLNETIDRFIAEALRCNLPITFANHATAPHAFDLMDDSETTREVIRQILSFTRFHLLS